MAQPLAVTYCHCSDCRRLSGAPVAAFAGFRDGDVSTDLGEPQRASAKAQRWFCTTCGTQLAARYKYLPDQTYVPLGIIDQIEGLPPSQHAHTGSGVSWLRIDDDLPRHHGSSRDALNDAAR